MKNVQNCHFIAQTKSANSCLVEAPYSINLVLKITPPWYTDAHVIPLHKYNICGSVPRKLFELLLKVWVPYHYS